MSIKSNVRNALVKITSDLERTGYSNEQQVIQSAIMPVLDALGWDIFETKQVKREYDVEGTRVDIALHNGKKSLVFIEAKAVDKINPKGERQAFNYAVSEGVSLYVLTDGKKWLFYHPHGELPRVDKLFHELDITDKSLDECAGIFCEFLSREEVFSERAKKSARKILQRKTQMRKLSQRRQDERVQQSLPKAWQKLFEKSFELREMLKIEVEKDCRIRPPDEMIEEFLSTMVLKVQYGKKAIYVPRANKQESNDSVTSDHGNEPAKSLVGLKIQGFLYKGKTYKTDSGRGMLSEVLVLFHEKDKSFLKRFSAENPNLVNKQRYAIAPNQPEEKVKIWTDPLPIKGEEWYFKGNHGNNGIRSVLIKACEVMGIVYGKDFEILAESQDSLSAQGSGLVSRPHPKSEGSFVTSSRRHPKIIGYSYDGESYELGSGSWVLSHAVELFSKKKASFIKDFGERSAFRAVSKQQADLFQPDTPQEKMEEWSRQFLVRGEVWWVKHNYSRDKIEQVLKDACKVMGVSYGKDFKLIIKT